MTVKREIRICNVQNNVTSFCTTGHDHNVGPQPGKYVVRSDILEYIIQRSFLSVKYGNNSVKLLTT